MDMNDILTDFGSALRTALTCPVEIGWRTAAPSVLTVMLEPDSESAEDPIAVHNTTQQEYSVRVVIEVPDTDSASDIATLTATVESVKNVVAAHRWLTASGGESAWSGKAGPFDYGWSARLGVATPNRAAEGLVTWTAGEDWG